MKLSILALSAAAVFGTATTATASAPPGPLSIASASEPAIRISELGTPPLFFPIDPEPECALVNGFGGYSKAGGGYTHQGVDIGATEGQAVFAVENGTLYEQYDGRNSGLGWGLLSESDVKYKYYHLSGFAEGLSPGDWVERGQLIGYVGDTGNASPGGWHLHFEVRPGPSYTAVNPYPLLVIPDGCADYIGG